MLEDQIVKTDSIKPKQKELQQKEWEPKHIGKRFGGWHSKKT